MLPVAGKVASLLAVVGAAHDIDYCTSFPPAPVAAAWLESAG